MTETTNESDSKEIKLHEHSNENLLKIDTFDKYSTCAVIKKWILKELPPPLTQSPPLPLFPGLIRVNKNPHGPFLFLAFQSEEERSNAAALLGKVSYRGKLWKEVPVTDRDLQLTHKGGTKRKRESVSEGSNVAQYSNYPMEVQLEKKRKHCLSVLKSILPFHLRSHQACHSFFSKLYESPAQIGYRNHVNLTFGYTGERKPTLGFLKGSFAEGICTVESAVDEDSNIITMHPVAKETAKLVFEVFHHFSKLENGGLRVFDKVEATGFWRKLQIRHNVLFEVMVDLEIDETCLPSATLFESIKMFLAESLSSPEATESLKVAANCDTARIVSVQYHSHTGITSLPEDCPRHVLHGLPTLTEYACNLQFELSPTSFFQVNTPAMEVLLGRVAEEAGLQKNTTLLDLCCGTGTIGLSLAKDVREVIGIELVPSAVENARKNAERNNISNATFYAGRVEQILPQLIDGLPEEKKEDIVAILDPPRAGVVPVVLKWIRGTPSIRRVVYISCDQNALERDCPCLTKRPTKAYRGLPFEVTTTFAVDLFPHTPHVEMVAVLTRCQDETPADGDEEKEMDISAEEVEDTTTEVPKD